MARIGFVGLGNMGGPMARNLLKAGHQVAGYDLVPAALEAFAAAGGTPAASAAAAAARRRVRHHHAARRPACARRLARRRRHGRGRERRRAADRLLDHRRRHRPRGRSPPRPAGRCSTRRSPAASAGAEAGTLTFMVGGPDAAFASARPILAAMGKTIVHCGGAGAGQAAKICNNMMLGVNDDRRLARRLVLAEKLGLSHAGAVRRGRKSSGQCWAMTTYCPVPGPVPTCPANRDYKPGFAGGADAEGPAAGARRPRRAPGRRRRSAPRRWRCSSASSPRAAARPTSPASSACSGAAEPQERQGGRRHGAGDAASER